MITTAQTSDAKPHATMPPCHHNNAEWAKCENGRNGNGNDKTWWQAKMCSNTVTSFCGRAGDT